MVVFRRGFGSGEKAGLMRRSPPLCDDGPDDDKEDEDDEDEEEEDPARALVARRGTLSQNGLNHNAHLSAKAVPENHPFPSLPHSRGS